MENKVILVQFGSKAKPTERSTTASDQAMGLRDSPQSHVSNLNPVTTSAAVDMETDEATSKNDLLTLAQRNRANLERVRKERELANKAVLKSYRIK